MLEAVTTTRTGETYGINKDDEAKRELEPWRKDYLVGNIERLCGSREGTGKKSGDDQFPLPCLLELPSHCLNTEVQFQGVQKVQSAEVRLLGHRAAEKRAEVGPGIWKRRTVDA